MFSTRSRRGVAQPGSAPVLGTGGRKFESCRPDQIVRCRSTEIDKKNIANMKKLLLILGLLSGLASPVFALEAGERHADPYKVMTKGQVIGPLQSGSSDSLVSWFLVAYQGELYRCGILRRWQYSCVLLEPKIN